MDIKSTTKQLCEALETILNAAQEEALSCADMAGQDTHGESGYQHSADTIEKALEESHALRVMVETQSDLLDAVRQAHKKWGALHDIISDLVERGLINEGNFPDDKEAIVQALFAGTDANAACENALKKVAAQMSNQKI